MTKQSSNRHGFTMVELLIVVAIVVVLISLLLPALKKVRESAWTTQCMGNMRQMGQFMQMYAIDHSGVIPLGESEGRVPRAGTYPSAGVQSNGAYATIYWTGYYTNSKYSYMKGGQCRCPKNSYVAGYSYAVVSFTPLSTPTVKGEFLTRPWGTYAANSSQTLYFAGLRTPAVVDPSNFVVSTDTATQNHGPSILQNNNNPPPSIWFLPNGFWSGGSDFGVWLAHVNAANLLFADWRVERCDPKALKTYGVTHYWDYYGKAH